MPSGPPPKARGLAVRRNDPTKGFTILPAKGRTDPPPPWPLRPDVVMAAALMTLTAKLASIREQLDIEEDGRKVARLRDQLDKAQASHDLLTLQLHQAVQDELDLWDWLWRKPIGVLWERTSAEREVATYVRYQIRAEQGDLKAANEARQRSDRLGLNPWSLLRLRQEIERTDEVEANGQQRRAAAAPPKKREDPRSKPRS